MTTATRSELSLELPPIHLNQKQDDFIFALEEFVCIKGTWGCGKSLAGLLAANKECEEIANNLYLVIRKEWVDLRDSTMKDWEQWIGRPIVKGNEVHYKNGSILMFRHGDDINALKNSNLGGALMIQAEEMTEEDLWFLKGRLRRKEGTRQLRLECNYDGRNWIYKLFNEKKMGRLITTNTFDNEMNLPADYIPGLMNLPKKLQERHLFGSDADMEGMVWDEFSESRHIVEPREMKEFSKIFMLDHGVTNPTAGLWLAIDYDGNLYAIDEHYEKEKPVSFHADEIKKRNNEKVDDWLADPSIFSKTQSRNGQIYSIADEYRDNNLSFRPADNNVLAGINRVNEYFKFNKLFIFKNCVNLIDEVRSYKWQRIKAGIEKNEPDHPVKLKDHLCDCLRYGVMSRPSLTKKEEKKSEGWTAANMDEMEEKQYANQEFE